MCVLAEGQENVGDGGRGVNTGRGVDFTPWKFTKFRFINWIQYVLTIFQIDSSFLDARLLGLFLY